MAFARPGCEQQQDARALLAPQRVPFVRIEAAKHAGAGINHLFTRRDLNVPVENRHPGVFFHLVVAQFLTRVEHDQHRTCLVAGMDDEWVASSGGSCGLHQVPGLHGGKDRLSALMTLAVDQLPLGQIGTNCYLVRASREATDAVVVDPGADATEIRLNLARRRATCAGILLTHSHYDHIGALAELAEGTGAPVWLPEGEKDVFERPNDFYGGLGVSIRGYTGESTLLSGGESLDAGGVEFQVTSVPGHSPGHVAYFADGALFSGDVLFAGSVGRTDLPFGDWDTLLDSIRRLAESYPAETVVYPGHGPATTLGQELARNPFLAELRAS